MNRVTKMLQDIRNASNSGDTKTIAHLKRGAIPATEHYAWSIIAPYCDLTNNTERLIFLTIAYSAAMLGKNSLIKIGAGAGNVGATMKRYAILGTTSDPVKTYEKHFNRFISSKNIEDVCRQIRVIASMASGKKIPMDLELLYDDLSDFCVSSKSAINVKTRWGRAYWL